MALSPETRELVEMACACLAGPLSVLLGHSRAVRRQLRALARTQRQHGAQLRQVEATQQAHAAQLQRNTRRASYLMGALHLVGAVLGLRFKVRA